MPHAFAKCPDHCDRPPGFRLDGRTAGGAWGKSRAYRLTTLGWETAGYVLVDGRWQKRQAV